MVLLWATSTQEGQCAPIPWIFANGSCSRVTPGYPRRRWQPHTMSVPPGCGGSNNAGRETGEIAPRAQRYGPRPVLAPHLATLAALIQEQPDRTLADLQAALPTPASLATIWRAVTKLGLTLKKNGTRFRTGPAGRRGRPRAVGGDRSHA